MHLKFNNLNKRNYKKYARRSGVGIQKIYKGSLRLKGR